MAALSVHRDRRGIWTGNSDWPGSLAQSPVGGYAPSYQDLLRLEGMCGLQGLVTADVYHRRLEAGCQVGDREGLPVVFKLPHDPQHRGF